VTELWLVISLNEASEESVQLSYEHTLTLQSPSTSFNVESCLELTFTAQSQFSVKLVCVTFNGTYNEQPLYSSRQPLGFTPHKLKLALPATVNDYEQCLLAFQVRTMKTGVLAVISNISVFPGQCPPPCTSTTSYHSVQSVHKLLVQTLDGGLCVHLNSTQSPTIFLFCISRPFKKVWVSSPNVGEFCCGPL